MKTRVNNLFMFNRDKTILYYYTENIKEFSEYLKIHKSTLFKHLTKGTFYLGKYHFSSSGGGQQDRELSNNVLKFMNLSLPELKSRLMKDREKFLRKVKA